MNVLAKFNLLFSLMVVLVYAQAPTNYTLGPNLVANGNFQSPLLSSGTYISYQNSPIPSWSCTYFCKILYMPIYCTTQTMSCLLSSNQMIDLDSIDNQRMTQQVQITSVGWYNLSFQWAPPVYSGIGRFLQIYFDTLLVQNITITPLNAVTTYVFNYSKLINVTSSNFSLVFQMGGSSIGYGIMLDNIAFQSVIQTAITTNTTNTTNTNSSSINTTTNSTTNGTTIPTNTTNNQTDNNNQTQNDVTKMSEVNQLMDFLFFNQFQSTANSMPGGRVFFSVMLNCLTNFDRLQLYFFHNQNFTQNSFDFLKMIDDMQNQKGSLIQMIVTSTNDTDDPSSFSQAIQNFQDYLMSMLNFKLNYSDPAISNLDTNGSFFYANNFSFFYYSILGTLILHFLFYGTFKLLHNFRISIFFRKYCFLAVIMFQFIEGNTEQFTFFFFQDIKSLFAFKPSHKLWSAFLIYFYFVIFFFSVAGILLLQFCYRKKVKYFIQQSKRQIFSLAYLAFQVGVIPISFGMAHSLLMHNLMLQTLVLISLELFFCLFYLYYLANNIFDVKLIMWTKIVTSLLRVFFNITFYFNNISQQQQQHLINEIHHALILLYAICWFIQLLFGVVYSFAELFKTIKLFNKSQPKQTKQHLPSAKTTMKMYNSTTNKLKIKRCAMLSKHSKTYYQMKCNKSEKAIQPKLPSPNLTKQSSQTVYQRYKKLKTERVKQLDKSNALILQAFSRHQLKKKSQELESIAI